MTINTGAADEHLILFGAALGLTRLRPELRDLSGARRLALAGAGATAALAASADAELLDGDPVTQAARLVTAR